MHIVIPDEVEAEFMRPKQVHACFGITRSYQYRLMEEGLIKSKLLRRKGNIRGVRLIDVASVREFIHGQAN